MTLFLALANDAGNWAGTPMVDITKEQRGNLTQLKTANLIETFTDDYATWADFTDAGKELAAENGIEL
jgi:hypothetical protein